MEDKAESKSLDTFSVSILMETPHSNKQVPRSFHSWILACDVCRADNNNAFMSSRLASLSATSDLIPFIPESAYRVPGMNQDGLPLTYSGNRRFSEAQESAQLLGGMGMPRQVLKDLVSGCGGDIKTLLIANLTPWEGDLELAAAGLQRELTNCPKIKTLSVSQDHVAVNFAQARVAQQLMEDRPDQ